MTKVNLFFVNDSSDMERFLGALLQTGWVRSGLVQPDKEDEEGTALFVDETVFPQLEEMAEEYNLEVVK